MNTGQVYDLFRSLIDEPDETFLTLSQAQTMCDLGYREFRQTVAAIDPEVYTERVYITVSGKEHSLTGLLYSTAALAATNPAQKIVRIGSIDNSINDSLSYYLSPAQTPVQTENLEGDYCLSGTTLVFAGRHSGGNLRIEYIPESTIPSVDWNDSGTTFIDNLTVHHPLIALYAARYYMVRDGAPNTTLIAQLMTKEKGLEEFLTVGRTTDSSHYIVPQFGYNKIVNV